MILRRLLGAVAVTACLLAAPFAVSQELIVKPDHANGVYATGERIKWAVLYKGANASEASLVLKRGGMTELRKGVVRRADGKGEIEASLDEPGWLLAEVTVRPENAKAIKALGGALVA